LEENVFPKPKAEEVLAFSVGATLLGTPVACRAARVAGGDNDAFPGVPVVSVQANTSCRLTSSEAQSRLSPLTEGSALATLTGDASFAPLECTFDGVDMGASWLLETAGTDLANARSPGSPLWTRVSSRPKLMDEADNEADKEYDSNSRVKAASADGLG